MIDHRLILVLGIFLLSRFAGLSPTTKEEEEMSGQLRDFNSSTTIAWPLFHQ
jgi:hypothetical protein